MTDAIDYTAAVAFNTPPGRGSLNPCPRGVTFRLSVLQISYCLMALGQINHDQ